MFPWMIFLKKYLSNNFTTSYQEKIVKKYSRIIYIIDECQRYIPKRFYNKDVVFYFDYHRHYSHDIYLITQDIRKICLDISTLVEIEFRAIKSSFHVLGTFRYLLKSSGEIFETKTIKKSKQIFDLYKSFDGSQEKKPKPKLIKYMILSLFLVPFLFAGSIYAIANKGEKTKRLNPTIKEEKEIINQNSISQAKETFPLPEPVIYKNVPITDFIAIKNQLVSFRCPISGDLISPIQATYKLFSLQGRFYASVDSSLLSTYADSLSGSSGHEGQTEPNQPRKTLLPRYQERESNNPVIQVRRE
jgi:hypothetical protein